MKAKRVEELFDRVNRAFEDGKAGPDMKDLARLTLRQEQAAKRFAAGETGPQIAKAMELSTSRVYALKAKVLKRLDAMWPEESVTNAGINPADIWS